MYVLSEILNIIWFDETNFKVFCNSTKKSHRI